MAGIKTKQRLCIKPWSVTAKNGDHFELEAGKYYTTLEEAENGEYIIFSNFWVRVPTSHFMGGVTDVYGNIIKIVDRRSDIGNIRIGCAYGFDDRRVYSSERRS